VEGSTDSLNYFRIPGVDDITFTGGAVDQLKPLELPGEAFTPFAFNIPAFNGFIRFGMLATGNIEASESCILDNVTIREASSIAGRHLFYNQSFFDGNNAAASASDDAAIDTTKAALLPGATGTFANYSSYSRGLNGVMVDIAGSHGTIGVGDLSVKVGNNNAPSTWAAGPAPTSVTLRAGAGVGGSDRYTLIWANGAIAKQWAQITVLANANTGLASPDVFYFGNAIGEVGNITANAIVSSADEALIRLNFTTGFGTVPVTSPYDIDKNRFVQTSDAALSRANQTTAFTALRLIAVPAESSPLGPREASEAALALDGSDLALTSAFSVRRKRR
jgi:hypothetical protein